MKIYSEKYMEELKEMLEKEKKLEEMNKKIDNKKYKIATLEENVPVGSKLTEIKLEEIEEKKKELETLQNAETEYRNALEEEKVDLQANMSEKIKAEMNLYKRRKEIESKREEVNRYKEGIKNLSKEVEQLEKEIQEIAEEMKNGDTSRMEKLTAITALIKSDKTRIENSQKLVDEFNSYKVLEDNIEEYADLEAISGKIKSDLDVESLINELEENSNSDKDGKVDEPKDDVKDDKADEPKDDVKDDKPDDIKQDKPAKQMSITINKKTGEVTFGDDEINRTFMMNSQDYKKSRLEEFRKDLIKWFGIEKDDQKYLENIDPTIFIAYYMYDKLKGTSEEELLCREYTKTVIDRSKAIENDEEFKENSKLAKIKIDIGWHPRQKSKLHNSKERFGFKNIIASFRANKILKKHGMTDKFTGLNMDLATVVDNRRKFGFIGLFAAAGAIGYLSAANMNPDTNVNQPRTDIEKENDNHDQKDDSIKTNDQNTFNESIKVDETTTKVQDIQAEKDYSRIQFGEEINVEKYSSIYENSGSTNPNGALGNNEKLGVNKIACQIDGKTYSTKDYTFDEIYDMAEKAGVDVRYHVDKIKNVGGKDYVNVNDTYVYNDNGTLRTEDGKEWIGDVNYSSVAGWMDSKDVKKAVSHEKQQSQNEGEEIEI